ncbi:MmcQ/YjbR family DNA-binding protein [Massilia horti]|uniref:MmcQ/YjbR family DNA-binding protein n=1 Tax=Massilia horti TaxID=2562153 RepID=A0A4Y9STL0_9BURK|nr:MmcQ/YjbR family DNA-binding protein [Massilia horti]TFW28574.1 MmcQ/YjbR family DNA-binding protein [Massilia horti]
MKFSSVRKYALSLPEAAEAPHFNYASFRVRGKIFVTVPPGDEFIHIFVSDESREQALALYPQFVERLMWGNKVIGVRITLAGAIPSVVKGLIFSAWQRKAPKSLQEKAFDTLG